MALLKHWTSSVFIFAKQGKSLKLALLHHKKLDKWMIPGGHLEPYENPAEAAIRETKEETGLEIEFFSIKPNQELGAFSDATPFPMPEYIMEEIIPAHKDQPEHVHLDCLYLAWAKETNLANNSESHGLAWYTKKELEELNMFESTKKIAQSLFAILEQS